MVNLQLYIISTKFFHASLGISIFVTRLCITNRGY